ncbi:MAG: hypothetical protein ABJB04_08660 [Betaproteobacteria bacterium]
MRTIFVALTIAALTGCGADTMGNAATAALLKKQELEQGKKTMQQAQQKIDQAVQQMNQSAQRSADDGIK